MRRKASIEKVTGESYLVTFIEIEPVHYSERTVYNRNYGQQFGDACADMNTWLERGLIPRPPP